jgi:cytochrome b6-f complex iron-sulfur subunit
MTQASVRISSEESSFLTSRRGLLKGLGAFWAAVGLGNLFYGVYRFLAPGGGALPPLEVPLTEIPAGGSYTFQMGGLPGIVIHDEDGSLRAYSLICTHLACTVAWKPEKREFHCPCHDGIFDALGAARSGPPPSPLERWNVQVKNDKVFIGMV